MHTQCHLDQQLRDYSVCATAIITVFLRILSMDFLLAKRQSYCTCMCVTVCNVLHVCMHVLVCCACAAC